MPPSQPARQLALPESTRLPAAVTPWMGCTCRGQQQHNLASEQYCFAFGPPHASAAFLPARPIGGRHRRCRCAVEQPARRSTCAAEHQAIAPASQAPSSTPSKTHPTFRQVPPSAPRPSTQATLSPSCAALMAATYPPGPPPMITTSFTLCRQGGRPPKEGGSALHPRPETRGAPPAAHPDIQIAPRRFCQRAHLVCRRKAPNQGQPGP